MASANIRTFQGADLDAVVSIWNRALTRDPITEGRFIQWLYGDPDYWPGEDSGFFVAVREGKPVGFARAIIRRNQNDRLGLEPEMGWLPVMAVDPDYQRDGIGTLLLNTALEYFRQHGRKKISIAGKSGSAPGYFFAGIDKDAYDGALALFLKAGFRVRNDAVSMTREIVDFPYERLRLEAWSIGKNVEIRTLTQDRIQDFLVFMAEAFPGDWVTAARSKLCTAMHEILIATVADEVVGYCQWSGEHFGPFGVRPEYRNHKIGAKLFVEAAQRIRAADGRTVWFNWADEDAARFYRRFGLTAQRHFKVLDKAI